MALLYKATKAAAIYFMKIFYKSATVVGASRVPQGKEATIVYSNHNNCYMDVLVKMTSYSGHVGRSTKTYQYR